MASVAIDPEPSEVAPRLSALDLTVEDLLLAVRTGAAARRTATRHHPSAYGGWRDYGERVAALRDALAPRGWVPAEDEGVCLTVHPQRRLALMTALGSSGTGTRSDVSTLRKRGRVTERIVMVNGQIPLDLEVVDPGARAPLMPTWVLLVHGDQDEIRSELSLARHIGDDGFIDRWLDRIPLPVIRLNDFMDGTDPDEPPYEPDFDIPEL